MASKYNALEIAESYINGNISWVKAQIKHMGKYDFLQLVWALQNAGVPDSKIEKLVE